MSRRGTSWTKHDDVQPSSSPHRSARDVGSALPLVLVMMVIGSLIVIPTMRYAMTVMRANTVLSDKTKRVESVKSGLRISLSDPARLYEACGAGGPTSPITLAPVSMSGGIDVTNRCYFIDYEAAQSAEELRYGLTATQANMAPPADLSGKSYTPVDPASTTEWHSETTVESATDKIWLPNLPVHGLNRRSPDGTQMPSGYPTCTVYFPGTYGDPVVLDGPTYFTSGVYYFENEVRVEGGANVTVGMGAIPGCTTDQEAIFYAENVPGTHNMSGLGATWILGDAGRLVVSNANNVDLSLEFNKRYVAAGDPGDAPSEDVSIITVNGELAPDGVTGIDLSAPGIIDVPASVVGAESPVPATSQEYLPSVYTPKPTEPDAPMAMAAQRYSGAAKVSWTAPFDGGSPITGYTVSASTGGSCSTTGATTCVIPGLTNGTPVSFTAIATNAVGDSIVSDPSPTVTPGGSTSLTVTSKPAKPTAVPYAGAAQVSWTAPSSVGGAPVTSYTVTASPSGKSCTVPATGATAPTLKCNITGLDPLQVLPGHSFTVTATNAMGDRTSDPSTPVITLLSLSAPPEIPGPPAPAAFVPTAVVEFDLPQAAVADVRIPGYVAIPQGRFHVDNPTGQPVVLAGGVLAAQFDVVDGRAAGPQTVDIGFLESIVQRKFRIVSTTNKGLETSTAVVQVNQNGAYAINSWEVQ